MNDRADEILVSTCIYDSVSKEPYAGYVAVKDGNIAAVGKGRIPDAYQVQGVKISDYGDGTICAGFGDTHTFFTGYILDEVGYDLSEVKTTEELRAVVERQMHQREVILGNHMDPGLAAAAGTAKLLNEVCGRQPAVLFVPGHGTCAMNRAAEARFGFDQEHCNAEALCKLMAYYLKDREFVERQLTAYMRMLNNRGVTSVKEMGFDDFYGFTEVLKDFEERQKLTVRISFMSQPVAAPINIAYGKKMRDLFQSEYVRFSGYNQMTDGLILAEEGHLLEPYEGTDTVCRKKIDYQAIEKDVLEADRNGFRFTLHSEGDGAFREILDIYEKCRKKDGTLLNRHGITDLELTDPEDERRMARLGVFGEIYAQIYMWDTYEGYVDGYRKKIGSRQSRYLNYRSLADHGVRLCGATDLPLLLPDVPESVYYGCANYGKDKGKRINPQNGLTISEMLDAWTVNSQYAMEREAILGTIEAGKRADLVVFDGDLFHTEMKDILNIRVKRTMVEGRDVFTR